jgi:phosphohistidine phosphatase
LTEIGRKKMRKGANRLRSQVDGIDLLACSPLAARPRNRRHHRPRFWRCCRLWSVPNWTIAVHLKPCWHWLAQGPAEGLLVAVGHEPHLSLLSGLLLAAAPVR